MIYGALFSLCLVLLITMGPNVHVIVRAARGPARGAHVRLVQRPGYAWLLGCVGGARMALACAWCRGLATPGCWGRLAVCTWRVVLLASPELAHADTSPVLLSRRDMPFYCNTMVQIMCCLTCILAGLMMWFIPLVDAAAADDFVAARPKSADQR